MKQHARKSIKINKFGLLAAVLPVFLTGCVHEWPEEASPREMQLTIAHQTLWTETEMTVTRADAEYAVGYHLRISPVGNPTLSVGEVYFSSNDLSLATFDRTVSIPALPAGDYDIWAWSDYVANPGGESLFYNSADFKSISYLKPYRGNTELRDAFRGKTTFTVTPSIDAETYVTGRIDLERPFARYEFIATDLADFIRDETTKGELFSWKEATKGAEQIPAKIPDLGRYKVKVKYTGYMPSVFDNYQNKPVDSELGVVYDAKIEAINDTEARLCFDYVMVNGTESGIIVALEIYDSKGTLLGRTKAINVPTKRSRNTIVRGRFLTSKASGGVGINPDFDGEFNIEIK